MSLILESYVSRRWVRVGELQPGSNPGSFSDNPSNSPRQVYLFECFPDNSKSAIYRSKHGLDINFAKSRDIHTTGLELVKELSISDPTYEKLFKTDRGNIHVRFTHIN